MSNRIPRKTGFSQSWILTLKSFTKRTFLSHLGQIGVHKKIIFRGGYLTFYLQKIQLDGKNNWWLIKKW